MTPVPPVATGEGPPFDQRLDPAGAPSNLARRWPARRLAAGLSPTPRPGIALLLLGTALGPQGLGVLSESVLSSLDPAVSAALAALGVLIGLNINARELGQGRLVAAASVESGATILLVSLGLILLHGVSRVAEPAPWLLALLLGICAVPSSTAAEVSGEPRDAVVSGIRDFGDVVPIVLGLIAVAWAGSGTPAAAAGLIAQGSLMAAAIAFAAWLLVTQTSSESEQRVFTIGALLLLGGAAAQLSVPALFVGLIAGVVWSAMGTAGRDHIARDLQYLQHPLLLLLLLFAGARLAPSVAAIGLVVAYIVLRLGGKVVGGWLAGQVARERPRQLGWSLIAPGVVAIAMALDPLLTLGVPDSGAPLMTIVIAGSLGSELVSWLVSRRDGPA